MTKQEAIREVIDTYTDDVCLYPNMDCEWRGDACSSFEYCADGEGAYNCLMKRLGELGVVLKAERELPNNPYPKSIFTMDIDDGVRIQREKLGDKLTTAVNGAFARHIYSLCQEDMEEAGYLVVKPLTEE